MNVHYDNTGQIYYTLSSDNPITFTTTTTNNNLRDLLFADPTTYPLTSIETAEDQAVGEDQDNPECTCTHRLNVHNDKCEECRCRGFKD